jgi:hypothetical protein
MTIELTEDVAERVLSTPEELLPLNVLRAVYVQVRYDELASLIQQWTAGGNERCAMELRMVIARENQ